LPVPDPDHSECVFPEGTLCAEAFAIQVSVGYPSGAYPDPVVWADFELVSGAVTLPEPFEMQGDPAGAATLDYAEGIAGHGEVRIKVYADGVLLCTSEVFLVDPDCAVPVRPLTWSALKRVWPAGSPPASPRR